MIENKELARFYADIQEEVHAGMLSEEEGKNPEQIFTEFALSILEEVGETENYRICYDEKLSKRGIEHKVNAYALYENYETLDLFITIYNSSNSIQSLNKTDAERAIERLTKFFRNSVYKDYVNEIEESSEIFDIAQTLANIPEIKEFLTRVNIFLITNCGFKSELKSSDKVAGYLAFYRVVDINYLFNLSEKSGVPIEIDFESSGVQIPCIDSQIDNSDYHSYLAIVPGAALASVYEQYGPRLLEQNVRSFLQFTGKINKGIRKTILEEPHMFLAFNNGIAATAEEVKLIDLPGNNGKGIGYVKDFQIVNGGQTTASIYHTWNKNKAEISKIFVQLKLTIINDRNNFSEIVGRIAEYANTQNRVSASDLSSNRENHVILEKLSRTIWAPPKAGESLQTRWFYERSRGQYKNEKSRFGITPPKRKQFEKQNPRHQMFTKELLAKYVNSYRESYARKKLVIGPHFVVRGSQKNYAQFLNYNFDQKPDSIFFEDAIALAILFKTAEKVYGISPNAIGDMRYITVPYSIAWLGFTLEYDLDLYKIWKKQELSQALRDKLKEIMLKIEQFIKKAPNSLYGEWAKKEECWQSIKVENFGIDLSMLSEWTYQNNKRKRIPKSESDIDDELIKSEETLIRSISTAKWAEIGKITKEIPSLSQHLKDRSINILSALKLNKKLSDNQRSDAIKIIDIIISTFPEFFDDYVSIPEKPAVEKPAAENDNIQKITHDLIAKMVEWDTKAKVLSRGELQYVADFAYGLKKLNDFHEKNIKRHLNRLMEAGFTI
jgi:hypothetical protein